MAIVRNHLGLLWPFIKAFGCAGVALVRSGLASIRKRAPWRQVGATATVAFVETLYAKLGVPRTQKRGRKPRVKKEEREK